MNGFAVTSYACTPTQNKDLHLWYSLYWTSTPDINEKKMYSSPSRCSQVMFMYRTTTCHLTCVHPRSVYNYSYLCKSHPGVAINGTIVVRWLHDVHTITCDCLPPLCEHFDRSQVFEHVQKPIFGRTFTGDYLRSPWKSHEISHVQRANTSDYLRSLVVTRSQVVVTVVWPGPYTNRFIFITNSI